jgi:hypothetical protein
MCIYLEAELYVQDWKELPIYLLHSFIIIDRLVIILSLF